MQPRCLLRLDLLLRLLPRRSAAAAAAVAAAAAAAIVGCCLLLSSGGSPYACIPALACYCSTPMPARWRFYPVPLPPLPPPVCRAGRIVCVMAVRHHSRRVAEERQTGAT